MKLVPELILGSLRLGGRFLAGLTQLIIHGLVHTTEGIGHLKGNRAIKLRLHGLLSRAHRVDLLLLPLHIRLHLGLHRRKGPVDLLEVCT